MRPRPGAFCFWCKRQLEASTSISSAAATFDHVVPQSRGGRKCVPCCFNCNNLKGEMTPAEWDAFRAAFPVWWKRFPRRPGRAA